MSGNFELSLQLPGCPQLIILFLLEAKKQDWHFAEVLQLKASLQLEASPSRVLEILLSLPVPVPGSIEHNLPGPFDASTPAPGTPHVHQHHSLTLQLHTSSAIQATPVERKF